MNHLGAGILSALCGVFAGVALMGIAEAEWRMASVSLTLSVCIALNAILAAILEGNKTP